MRSAPVWLALALTSSVASAQPEPEQAPPVTTPPTNDKPPEPATSAVTAPLEVAKPEPVKTEPNMTVGDVVMKPASAAASERGFRFGSYGRVIAGSDLRGGKPEAANVVAHGPRVVEASYLELDFSYGFESKSGRLLRPVITLAFDGTLFHDTGDFDARPALRNMFLEAEVTKHATAWVGSRMYRGDDIYLFDYWPLDDLNTVGGGIMYRRPESDRGGNTLELAAHAGVNRLNNDFQFQQIDVADPEQGAATIVQLNRQRLVLSGTAAYLIDNGPEAGNYKVKVHGEFHALPSGTRKRTDGTLEDLPADTGYLVGVEVGTWGYAAPRYGFRRHVNLFARYARGLASFDELAPPTSFGADLKTTHANELSFGASANWDDKLGNLMVGVLSRRFVDADGTDVDRDDGWEYAVDARPLLHIGSDLYAGADVSYQARFPRGLNPNTQRAEDPAVFQIAPMLVYSPMGPSGYDRPQLRLVYRAAYANDAARDLFVPDDPRHAYNWTFFLGVQAEWWWNSSTYKR